MDTELKEKTQKLVDDCLKHGVKLSKPIINLINSHNMKCNNWYIESLNDITMRSEADIMNIRGVGRSRLKAIQDLLVGAGMSLSSVGFRNNPELDNLINEHLETERKNKWIQS
jgi:DNA-directed RNA polymerase alpha subunit